MYNITDTDKLARYLAMLLDIYKVYKPAGQLALKQHEIYEEVLRMLNNYPDKIVLVEKP